MSLLHNLGAIVEDRIVLSQQDLDCVDLVSVWRGTFVTFALSPETTIGSIADVRINGKPTRIVRVEQGTLVLQQQGNLP